MKKILCFKHGIFFLRIIFVYCVFLDNLIGQHYFSNYFNLGVGETTIAGQNNCVHNYFQMVPGAIHNGVTMTPALQFILLQRTSEWNLLLIDQVTGSWSSYFTIPPPIPGAHWGGLVSIEDGVYYTILMQGNILFRIDVASGILTNLGPLPYFNGNGDLAAFDGEIYYPWSTPNEPNTNGIIRLNINQPEESAIVVDLQGMGLTTTGISATQICNTIVATEFNNQTLIYINLIDGVVTNVCENDNIFHFTSLIEFESPTICEIYLDLDENDSSGAPDADYNSEEFDCTKNGVYVSDHDITLLYDALITDMTIELTGVIPDGVNETLFTTGSTQNIDITGSGTSMITLSNAGGAKSTDFKNALRKIKYDNTAAIPSGGLRTVEVQFTTESGAMSNVATAFIEVVELPLIPVDIGPDQEICEGETATFDAGISGAEYEWSGGQTTQTITVSDAGEYIVTVSDGENCPNQDTVELTVLPVIHVSLEGDIASCDNAAATLTIVTDSPFPIDVVINVSPGSPITLTGISGPYSFTDLPTEETEYTIASLTPSQPACIEITDPFQGIDVYPSYQNTVDASICEGDSIWLGYYWETLPGTYENTFETIEGCDSVVTTNLAVLSAITMSLQSKSCNAADTGVFIQFLNNPNGCDTIVETTVMLSPSDTTFISGSTCNSQNVGITTTLLTNQKGCDSLIITTTTALPPEDTTSILAFTCDSMAVGITQAIYLNAGGCDSLVMTTVSLSPADTSYLYGISCDPASIGTTQQLFENSAGCDSLVITTITSGVPDTTYVNTTSCDSSSLGVFEEVWVGQDLCDSLVITTVTFSESDHTDLNSLSCDPDEVGVFTDTLTNRFGCDSIVTLTVSLSISHDIQLSSSSCHPADTGVFVQHLVNQFGCDSIITETVSLLPSDETFLFETTCHSDQAGMFIATHFNQYGCDSTVTLTVSLVESDTTELIDFTCDPSQVFSQETLLTGQDGCDSLVIESTALHPLPELDIEVTSDFNGFPISCTGAGDGSVTANAEGIPPFTFAWSTGDTNQSITGLSVGTYHVTITDGNECESVADITLADPPEFSIGFIVSQPDCFDAEAGSIEVDQQGGIEPIRYSIDGIHFQSSLLFENLSGGTYEITAYDANDCEVKEIIWLNVPLQVNVELGDNMIIIPGDTVVIEAIVNVPYDSLAGIIWTGLTNPDCPNCLTQPVVPIITTTYSVTVSTHDGCTDEDEMTLFLERNHDIFIPNIFTPNGDGVNDEIVISGGRDVKRIISFLIYDRWGNVVFEGKDFAPGDETVAWDGTFRDEGVNPGVFAYRVIAELEGGESVVRYGDITLMR